MPEETDNPSITETQITDQEMVETSRVTEERTAEVGDEIDNKQKN